MADGTSAELKHWPSAGRFLTLPAGQHSTSKSSALRGASFWGARSSPFRNCDLWNIASQRRLLLNLKASSASSIRLATRSRMRCGASAPRSAACLSIATSSSSDGARLSAASAASSRKLKPATPGNPRSNSFIVELQPDDLTRAVVFTLDNGTPHHPNRVRVFPGLRGIAQRGSGKSAWNLNGNAGRRRKNPSKKLDPRRA